MYIFPLLSTAVSLVFAVMLGRQYAAKRRPFQLAWSAAMAMYGLASLAEVVGQISGWNNPVIKTYYIFGALLVVGYLALGTLYIQSSKVASGLIAAGVVVAMTAVVPIIIFNKTAGGAEKAAAGALFGFVFVILLAAAFAARPGRELIKIADTWLVTMIAVTAGGVALTAFAPVDASQLAALARGGAVPYEAIERSLFLKGTVVAVNTLGGFVLIGGALYSSWGLIRKSVMREQAIGTMLIGLGAVFPYSAGLLSGYFEAADQALKSIFLTVGIIIMFIGFLQTGRTSGRPPVESPAEAKVEVRSV